MTRLAVSVLVAFAMAACSKPVGSVSAKPAPPPPTCPAFMSAALENQNTKLTAQAHDPFLTRGKFHVKSAGIARGQKLSVTLREQCASPGTLASEVLRSHHGGAELPTRAGVRSYHWQSSSAMTAADFRARAEQDPCVVGVTEAHVARVLDGANEPTAQPQPDLSALTTDPLVGSQGHLATMQAAEGFPVLYAQTPAHPITIAVIDTGIDADHEDLQNVLWTNPGEIAANGIDDDKNGYVDDVIGYNFATGDGDPTYSTTVMGYQHGTHVAGLAAAQGGNRVGGAGVASFNTRIMALNVFAPYSLGADAADIANAIRYAADNGADVINISLGGEGESATYESALAYAVGKGVVVMAAAGNDHVDLGSPEYFMSPASYASEFAGVIAVGSIDSSTGALSSYSNYSPYVVKFAAPGSEDSKARLGLLSTWAGGSYKRIQGTSMASPVAAGAAAAAISMMRARGYKPSAATVEKILEASSPQSSSLKGYIMGGRVLNLKSLGDFIDKNYATDLGDRPVDPGVPGFKACGS